MANQEQIEREQRKRRIAGMFSRSAPNYDSVGPRFFSHFGQRLVEHARIAPNEWTLDVAAGSGATFFPALERVGSGGYVVGIDLAEGMVNRLKAEIARQGLKNADALVMDAEELNFPDATFDCVMSGFAVFFFPQPERALTEFHRVLKPGGRLALSTWGVDDERWKFMEHVNQKYAQLPAQWASTSAKAETRPVFKTPEGMQAFVAETGFSNIEVIPEDVEFTYADEEEWLAVGWSHGMRGLLERLAPEDFELWKGEMFENVRKLKRDDGIPHRFAALFTLATK